jgi:hypothetical protein
MNLCTNVGLDKVRHRISRTASHSLREHVHTLLTVEEGHFTYVELEVLLVQNHHTRRIVYNLTEEQDLRDGARVGKCG